MPEPPDTQGTFRSPASPNHAGPYFNPPGQSGGNFAPGQSGGNFAPGQPGRPVPPPSGPLYGPQGAPSFPGGGNNAPGANFSSGPAYMPVPPAFPPAGPGSQGPYSNTSSPNSGPKARKGNIFKRARNKISSFSLRTKIILLILVAALLIPSIIAVFEGINAYTIYGQARSAINHLQTIQGIFSSGGSSHGNMAKYFDVNKLHQAQTEITAAHADLQQLSTELDQDGSIGLLGGLLPQQIGAARSLSHVGLDATEIGQQVIQSAIKMGPSLSQALSNPLNNGSDTSSKPYITSANLDEIYADLNFALPRVHDMNMQTRNLAISSLPLSGKQSQLLTSVVKILPVADTGLTQASGMKNEVSWLLGVGQPRTFLVEPMDRAELRATGGFTGQFGELTLNGGHMAPLQLKNIGVYEEDHTLEGSPPDPIVYPKVNGQKAPAPYSAWWPVANFGMRDANLSADFPTSAKVIIDRYQYEFGKQVDGVIIFTPALISHILHVTGPITIPKYNETINEQNLEAKLHYYQLDNAGIRKEEIVENVNDGQQARKLFTQQVMKTLISSAQHLSTDKLLSLGNEMFQAMKSKDLQAYATNGQIESMIGKYGSTAAVDRSTTHDGMYVVQSNLSASKASQYVTTAMKDTVALDAAGNATHNLQITLDYQQKGDVYGMETYRDYMRIYTPAGSQFVSGNGFALQQEPLCSASAPADGYRVCSTNPYGDGTLVCSASPDVGISVWLTDNPSYAYGVKQPLDRVGAPTNQISDEAGRSMYGGWVVIPPNCTMKVSLSWTVPAANAHHPYTLLFQRQSSVSIPFDLTVQPASGTCNASKPADLHFSSTQTGVDQTITLNNSSGGACSLQAQPFSSGS